MRTVEVKLYEFHELSDEAKQKALDQFRNREYHYDEIKDTMKKFAEVFDLTIKSWELGYGRGTHISFSCHEEDELINHKDLFSHMVEGVPVKYWNQEAQDGSCPLTGVCWDCNVLDPLVNFMKDTEDITYHELMQRCFDSLVEACSNDVLYHCGDEATKYFIEANEYEFTEDGTHY